MQKRKDTVMKFSAVFLGLVAALSAFLTACGEGGRNCSDHTASSEECYECLGAVDHGSYIELTECEGATTYHFRINEACECS